MLLYIMLHLMLLYILVPLASTAFFSFLYLSTSILSLINKVLFEYFDKRHLCLSCCTMKANIRCTTARSSSWVRYSSLSIHSPWLCALSRYTSYGSTPKPSACSFLYLDHSSTDISVCSSHMHCFIHSNLSLKPSKKCY